MQIILSANYWGQQDGGHALREDIRVLGCSRSSELIVGLNLQKKIKVISSILARKKTWIFCTWKNKKYDFLKNEATVRRMELRLEKQKLHNYGYKNKAVVRWMKMQLE